MFKSKTFLRSRFTTLSNKFTETFLPQLQSTKRFHLDKDEFRITGAPLLTLGKDGQGKQGVTGFSQLHKIDFFTPLCDTRTTWAKYFVQGIQNRRVPKIHMIKFSYFLISLYLTDRQTENYDRKIDLRQANAGLCEGSFQAKKFT